MRRAWPLLAVLLTGCPTASVALDPDGGDTRPDFRIADLSHPDFAVETGLFYPASHYTSGAKPEALAVGDFNGDGKPDIAVANSVGYLSVLINDGQGHPQFPTRYPLVTDTPTALLAVDVNGDGKLDLVVANLETATISVLLNGKDGVFGKALNVSVAGSPVALGSADFNGDGKMDIVVVNRDPGIVTVLPGKGDGTFNTGQTSMAGIQPRSIAVGDWNGDKRADLATANSYSTDVNVLTGDGAGTFAPVVFRAGLTPIVVVTGDWNGDKIADLAVLNFGTDVTLNPASPTATILLGKGDGTFPNRSGFAIDKNPAGLAAGDLDGDKIMDLAIVSAAGDGVSVYSGKGDGTFGAAQKFSTCMDPMRLPVPDAVVLADMDGDGKLDIVVADFEYSDVAVLISNAH